MRRDVPRALLCCVPLALAVVGVTACTSSPAAPTACAGQCAPPFELDVYFRSGTPDATAQAILSACAARDPVVIRIGAVDDMQGGQSSAVVYTRDFASAKTNKLVKCLESSSRVAMAAWPD
jgi:hypothetical protein